MGAGASRRPRPWSAQSPSKRLSSLTAKRVSSAPPGARSTTLRPQQETKLKLSQRFETATTVEPWSEMSESTPAGVTAGEAKWEDWDDEEDVDDESPVRRLAEGADGEPSGLARAMAGRASRALVGVRGLGGGCTIGGASPGVDLDTPLICRHCAHCVYRFPGARWARSADYYWFRNFTPDARLQGQEADDLTKLAGRLEEAAASAAYSCGCSWQSVDGSKPLEARGTPAGPHGGARMDGDQLLQWEAGPPVVGEG